MFSHIPSKEFKNADAWIEGWYEVLETAEDTVVYSDDACALTKTQVEDLSGRIYGYLRQQGIGREDFVLILLPRGAQVFAAMLGVLKAGAAYVVIEAGYPAERTEFIKQDVGCKLVLDGTLLQEILAADTYAKGFEHAEDHDAAYAVYTSGTTGTPKGVVHERGSMHMSHISAFMEGDSIPEDVDHFAVLAPLNFSATMLIFNAIGNMGGELYIPSYDTLKNPRKLIGALMEHAIGTTFMAPSMLAGMAPHLPEGLTRVVTGSASADDVYGGEGRTSWNYYMASETCFVISMYRITAPTKPCPVGKPNHGIEAWLADDGQVVVRTPYCRGYINDSSEDSPFRDGCYYTGDVAREDEDGNFILSGRLSDMVKINGNRVEPAEIEAAFNAITGLECVAKGFEGREDAFVALYYVPDATGNIDTGIILDRMSEQLPYYMVPSYFVPITQIPKTPLGKIDRKQLAKPKTEHRPYIAPRTDLEKALCAAMVKTLDVARVGLADDFFELGGRSMDTIAILAELDLEGLSADMFYRGRTVAGIAQAYEDFLAENDNRVMSEEEKELEGRKHLYPLTDTSLAIFIMQTRQPDRTDTCNFPYAIKLTKLADMKKLCRVINEYTSRSSTFNTIIAYDEDKRPCYKYAPEFYKPIEVEKMTEEEVDQLRHTFIEPFRPTEELPWRIRLIKTKKANYLFIDMHHILTDADGLSLTMADFAAAYQGKQTHTNNLFAWLYEEDALRHSAYYQLCRDREIAEMSKGGWVSHPQDPTDEIELKIVNYPTGISVTELNEYFKQHKKSRGELFAASAALAIGRFTGGRNISACSVYANRTGSTNIGGVRARSAKVLLRLGDGVESLEEYMALVSRRYEEGVANSCQNLAGIKAPWKPVSIILDDLNDIGNSSPAAQKIAEPVELVSPPRQKATTASAVNMFVFFLNRGDQLIIRVQEDVAKLSDEARDRFAGWIIDAMKRIIAGDETVLADYLG